MFRTSHVFTNLLPFFAFARLPLAALALITGVFFLPQSAKAVDWQGDPAIALAVGQSDILDGVQRPTHFSAEVRARNFTRLHLTPVAGAGFSSDEASFLYAGMYADIWILDWWAITPGFAPGFFNSGDTLKLGSSLEFRSSIETSVRFKNGIRIGLSFSHVSNGGISHKNPGTESWSFVCIFPIFGK